MVASTRQHISATNDQQLFQEWTLLSVFGKTNLPIILVDNPFTCEKTAVHPSITFLPTFCKTNSATIHSAHYQPVCGKTAVHRSVIASPFYLLINVCKLFSLLNIAKIVPSWWETNTNRSSLVWVTTDTDTLWQNKVVQLWSVPCLYQVYL